METGKHGAQAQQRKTVSITVPPDLWTEFRIECLRHSVTASKAVEHLIRQQMRTWEQEAKSGVLES